MTSPAIPVTSNNPANTYESTQNGTAINDKNRLSTIAKSIKEKINDKFQGISEQFRLCYLKITLHPKYSALIDNIKYLFDLIISKFSNKLQDELAAACKGKNPGKITKLVKGHRLYFLNNINKLIFSISNKNKHVTPLTLACLYGQLDSVNKLLELKIVDVNAMLTTCGQYNATALIEAIQYLNDIQKHPNTITADSDDKSSPTVSSQIDIQETEEKAILDVIIRLINDNNIDLNKKDTDGFTPLMHACVNGQKDIVELLSKTAPLTIDETIKICEKSLNEDPDRKIGQEMEPLHEQERLSDEDILSDNGTKIEPFDYICQNSQYTIIHELNHDETPLKEIESGYEIFKKRVEDGAIDKQMTSKIESAFKSAFQNVSKHSDDG